MARWQSGYAADCKSVDLGSIPGRASIVDISTLFPIIHKKIQYKST